jgi:two-component system NtrC family sensor kinase
MQKFISIKIYIISIFCLLFNFSFSQKEQPLNNQSGSNDTILLSRYAQMEADFTETNHDSAIYYCYKALDIAKKLDQKYYQGFILSDLGYNFLTKGDYSNSLKYLIEATRLSEDKDLSNNIIKTPFIETYLQGNDESNRKELLGWIKNSLGVLYGLTGSPDKELNELLEAKNLIEPISDDMYLLAGITSNIVDIYVQQNKFDSALYYQRQTMVFESKSPSQMYDGLSSSVIGSIFQKQGKTDSAKKYLFAGVKIIEDRGENLSDLAYTYGLLANLYYDRNQPDSGIYYAKKAITNYTATGSSASNILEPYTTLALNYSRNKNYDSAYKYMTIAKNMSDSLNSVQIDNLSKFQSLGFEEKLRLKKLETETMARQNRNRITLLVAVIIVFFIIAFILYRNNKVKQKTNKILQSTLSNLKSTQAQLIQSEKMASLGELTAGIAHEIQNPLNFVNNFSDVNKELLEEMKDEIDKGNMEEVKALANNVIDNEGKINHHGKRAEAIVKGMLQHSRISTGQKEPTDINALCDEYLRLSYHGLRAKDKSFNAKLQTDFDATIGKINIVPQDIGRVLLNLFNNAFYAIQQKKNLTGFENLSGLNKYEPTVSVWTKKVKGKIEIRVKDNGIGIPQKVVDKIFQPFFTTKPTGQGTGLGLSLSYDIIKAHGGEIKVETKEGEGSEFVIQLPA